MTQAANVYGGPSGQQGETWSAERPAAGGRLRAVNIPLIGAIQKRLTNQHVAPKRLLVVTGQLATMLASGCDLCAGLEVMARQQDHPRVKKILEEVYETVKSGQPFSQALAKYPDVFSPLYVTMIRVGESAGLMRGMLSALQTMIRHNIRVVTAVRSALIYPIFLTCAAFSAIIVMTTFVLPRFAAVFHSSNVPLPLLTTIMLDGSAFMGRNAVWIMLGLLTAIISTLYLLTLPAVHKYTHAWVLRMPLIGPALQLSYVVRATQTLGMLIKAGLPLVDTLVLIRDLMPNIYYRQFFDELHEHIAEGKPLSPDFERTTLFPPMVSQMISVGEQTGTLSAVCLEVASFHEEEMQDRIKILTTALEPMIIVIMGGFVGLIACSVILPMFKITSALAH